MFALSPVRSSKAFFPVFNLGRAHFDDLIFSSSHRVSRNSIKNVQKLLEEAKEADRLMVLLLMRKGRFPNTYQVLYPRHRPEVINT